MEQKNLLTKLLEIQKATSVFTKNTPSEEKTKDGKAAYQYTKAIDVTKHFHDLCTQNGIMLRSDIVDVKTLMLNQGTLFCVTVDYTFLDTQTGETHGPVRGFGSGCNGSCKGYGSAVTSAMKYLLMTQFLSGSDDPADEIDTIVDKNPRSSAPQQAAIPQGCPAYAPQPYAPQPYAPQPYVQQPYAPQPYAPQPFMQQPYAQTYQPSYAPQPNVQQAKQPQAAQPQAAQPKHNPAYAAAGKKEGSSLVEDINRTWENIISTMAGMDEADPAYMNQMTRFVEMFANMTGNPPATFTSELVRLIRERKNQQPREC